MHAYKRNVCICKINSPCRFNKNNFLMRLYKLKKPHEIWLYSRYMPIVAYYWGTFFRHFLFFYSHYQRCWLLFIAKVCLRPYRLFINCFMCWVLRFPIGLKKAIISSIYSSCVFLLVPEALEHIQPFCSHCALCRQQSQSFASLFT